MNQKEVNRKLSCILSTDVVGYSRLMEENEAVTVQHLEKNKKLLTKLIEGSKGRVVDSPGDNILAEFSSAVKAVDCAVKIQKELKIKNAGLPEKRRMQFRIGINLGDVIEEDGNLYGSGVNIAARLEGMARPGEIYISRNVFDQVKTNLDHGYEYLGEHYVKNISEPVRVYRVLVGDEFTGKVIGEKKPRGKISRKIFGTRAYSGNKPAAIYSAIIILLVFIAGVVLIYQPWSSEDRVDGLPSRIHLAILPFKTINLTDDSKVWAAGFLTDMTAQLLKLSGRHPLTVFPTNQIREKNIRSVQEAYLELGANLVIEPSLQQNEEEFRISYVMLEAKTKRGLGGDSITATMSDTFDLMDYLVDSVLGNLGIDLPPEEKGSIWIPRTKKPKAANYYLKAIGYLEEYHKSENIQKAILNLQDALELDPGYSKAFAALGEALLLQYKYEKETKSVEEALSACNRALELDSSLASGHICLGDVFIGTGKYEKAAEEFKSALDLEPWNDEAYRSLGSVYGKLGLFGEAEKLYKSAIERNREYWVGYNELGSFYVMLGRFKEAEEMFNKVTELESEHHFGYSNLAGVYLYEGRYSEAIPVLKRSVELRPEEISYSNLGTAYFYLQKYDEAAAAYEKAIELNEKDRRPWGNLGDAYYWGSAGRARAEEAYRRALRLAEGELQLNPRDTRVLGFMAYYHAMLGEKEAAETYMKLALAEDPKDPMLFFNLAQTLCRLGEMDQALVWLKKAMEAGWPVAIIQNTPLLHSLIESQEFKDMLQDD